MKFSVEIHAPREIVWSTLWQDETFRQWAGMIDPGTYMKGELKSLADRLMSEQNARADAVKSLSDGIKDVSHAFEKKVTAIDEQAAKSESDLRQKILAQSKDLSDEIHKRHNDMLSALQRESSEIRDDKADRTALAELFTEMAMRLTNDFKMPDSD